MKDYGGAIQTLRKNKNMTQAELGEKLNVSSQAVSKWENGLSQPDLETLQKLTSIFEISIDEFAKMSDGNAVVKSENSPKKEIEEPEEKLLGVCTVCGRGIYNEATIGAKSPKLVCLNCHLEAKRLEKQKKDEEIRRKIAAEKASRVYFRKCLIIPAIIIVLLLGITIPIMVSKGVKDAYYYVIVSISAVLLWMAIPQALWDYGPVMWCFDVFFIKTFTMPGIIFSLDIDGIVWAIAVKIALAVLSVTLTILCSLFGIFLACIIAPFSFIPAICYANGEISKGGLYWDMW